MLVSEGRRQLESKDYGEARDSFESALFFDPLHRGARLGLNRVHRKLIPRWHFEMLNDWRRNSAYESALTKVVSESSVVLDIGSGSGLLAMMAARAGARETISCEMVSLIADLARETVTLNGLEDRIVILEKKSTEIRLGVDMTCKANVLVTETVDCGLLGEGVIASINHARANLLTANAVIIPSSARVVAVMVESQWLKALNNATFASRFDVSPINRYATATYFPVRLAAFYYKTLTDPFELFHFDFANGVLAPECRLIQVPVTRSGKCHAIVFWFEMHLDSEILLSNQPGSDTHWEQALLCIPEEISVEAGERVIAHAAHNCSAISVNLVSAGSTFSLEDAHA